MQRFVATFVAIMVIPIVLVVASSFDYEDIAALLGNGLARSAEAEEVQAEPTPAAMKKIVLDPGHGAEELGAAASFPSGRVLLEKDLNLRVAQEAASILDAKGFDVLMTRSADRAVNTARRDLNGDGRVGVSDDLQARVDFANDNEADLFVSIHFNSASNASAQGTLVIYNASRPFAAQSRHLADLVQKHLLGALKDSGYEPGDRGVVDDVDLLGYPLYVLSPAERAVTRAGQMPAVLGEGLFLSNAEERALVADEAVLKRLGAAYAQAVVDYFG